VGGILSIGALVNISAWEAAKADWDRNVDRASMYAIREAGRQINKMAKGTVPVRSGKLRKSITNSKRIRKTGEHDFAITAGPHGYPAFLYSGFIEERKPYMEPARSAIAGGMAGIYEGAVQKVLARYA
jgi:hypothetical protein